MGESAYKVGDDPVVLLEKDEVVVRSWRPEPGEAIMIDPEERVIAVTSDWFWLVRRETKRKRKITLKPGLWIEGFE